MLLGQALVPGYRGVDRERFEPMLLDADIDHDVQMRDPPLRLWMLLKPGWKRDAFRIYEEKLADGCGDDLFMLRTYDAALQVREFVRSHDGEYEVLLCNVFDLRSLATEALSDAERNPAFLGYDIAYPGGDCYSAVLNGLLVNPHKRLLSEFGPLLGTSQLLTRVSCVQAYIAEFRKLVPSERDAEFWGYAMFDPAQKDADKPTGT